MKDSGKRITYPSGMEREPSGEGPRFDLMILEDMPYERQPLYRVAKLLAMGTKKYEAKNYLKAYSLEEYERFKESAFRHFMQWFCLEEDEDHMAACVFNMFLAEYVLEQM